MRPEAGVMTSSCNWGAGGEGGGAIRINKSRQIGSSLAMELPAKPMESISLMCIVLP